VTCWEFASLISSFEALLVALVSRLFEFVVLKEINSLKSII
jgi:hypothetical protein